MTNKSGKKPLSTRRPVSVNPDDAFGNKLALPADIRKIFVDNGWEPRWLDGKKLQEQGGYHDRDWIVFRRPKTDNSDGPAFKFGNDPDGIVRRGSLILGYKPGEQAAKHRAFNTARADRFKSYNREKADELRHLAKENRLDVTIHEGYDDEDGE
jgi:hypothetical protein